MICVCEKRRMSMWKAWYLITYCDCELKQDNSKLQSQIHLLFYFILLFTNMHINSVAPGQGNLFILWRFIFFKVCGPSLACGYNQTLPSALQVLRKTCQVSIWLNLICCLSTVCRKNKSHDQSNKKKVKQFNKSWRKILMIKYSTNLIGVNLSSHIQTFSCFLSQIMLANMIIWFGSRQLMHVYSAVIKQKHVKH